MNVYIYKDAETITQTYTEAKFWNNTSWVTKTQSIYKPWYKVVKIEYDSEISAGSSTAYWTATLWYRQNSSSQWYWAYILYGWSISWNYAYQLSWPDATYQAPTSPEFWYTTVHLEITPEHIIINNWTWTINYTYNIPSASKSQIEALFSGTELEVFLRAIYPYLWPTTITVTYEEI